MEQLDEIRRNRQIPKSAEPISADVDSPDFNQDQAKAVFDKIFSIGNVREQQLNALLKLRYDNQYQVRHTESGYGAGFDEQANREHFKKKFPWLHDHEMICIDIDDAEADFGTFDDYLASIDQSDWDSFLEDAEYLNDDHYCIDDERSSELEMEESSRWLEEDGGPELIKELMKHCDDGYDRYLFSRITPELIYVWSRETENYPERDGDDSVYMNMTRFAEQVATHTWFLEHIPDDEAGWLAVKRTFFDEHGAAFDTMLNTWAQTDEAVAHTFNKLDAASLWELFQVAFDSEDKDDYAPYFYMWDTNGYDQPKTWVAGYNPRDYYEGNLNGSADWRRSYADALAYLKDGAEWFRKLVIGWFTRHPEGHPELKFESVEDEDRPEQLISQLPSRVDHLATLVTAKTCTKEEAVEYAIIQAESVLHIFEKELSDDKRPRQAIEAARKWWREPSEANRLAANDAAYAYAATYAAYAATNAAYAAYAATNAAYAAYAYAARDAAAYAAAAASAAYWADKAINEAKNAVNKRKRVRESAGKMRKTPVQESVEDDDDPARFLRVGGLREDVVYEDDKIRVTSPQELQALNHHLLQRGVEVTNARTWDTVFKYREVLIIIGKEPPDLTGHRQLKELGIISGDKDGFVIYQGSADVDKISELFTLADYGDSIHRMLIQYCRGKVEEDQEWGHALLQAGGVSELRRAARKGYLNLDEYAIIIGLNYIKRRQLAMAVRTFGRDPKTMTLDDVWLVFESDTDLASLFKNEDYASNVLSGDTYDIFDRDSLEVDASDVVQFLNEELMAHIREVMCNRRCFFPDAGPDGQGDYVLLTKKVLAEYDDKTLLHWITNPSQEDTDDGTFSDIAEALDSCGSEMLRSLAEDELIQDYRKAAISALDGMKSEWDKFTTKKGGSTFSVLVPWSTIGSWAENYRENNNEGWQGTLEELAFAVHDGTLECPDANNVSPSLRDMNKAHAVDFLDRLYELEVPEAPPGAPDYDDPKQTMLFGESDSDDPSSYISQLPSRVDHLATLVKAKTCTKEEAVEYAIIQAESVLHIFEKELPDDKRPRQAIEAARKWWREPSEANQAAAANAAAAAAYAAYAADAAACYAASAARATSYAAANAAADAYAAYAAAAADAAAYWADKARKEAAATYGINESSNEELDRPEMMPAATSGIPVGFERRAKLLIDQYARKGGAEASDITFELTMPEYGYCSLLLGFNTPNWKARAEWVALKAELDAVLTYYFKDHRLRRSYYFDTQWEENPNRLHLRFDLQEYSQAQRAADAALPF